MTKTICYGSQFIDSVTLMAGSLSNLVDNLAEEIHKIKYKYGQDDRKYDTCRINYKYCECFFEYTSVKNKLIE